MTDIRQIKFNRTISIIEQTLSLLEDERDGDWYSLNTVFVFRICTSDRYIRIYINDIYRQLPTLERTNDIDNEIIKLIKLKYKSKYYNLNQYKTTLIGGD